MQTTLSPAAGDEAIDRPRSPRFTGLAPALLVFLLALAVRLLPWGSVFAFGGTYLYDPDCYVRLRKILVYLQAFPATQVHDFYQGYPVGTGVVSPPTMEYLVAALLYPVRQLPQIAFVCQQVVVFAPALIGALTALCLFLFLRRPFGVLPALTAAVILSISPEHVEATRLARFDNEMLEPLLMLLTFGAYCRTYERDGGKWPALSAGLLSFVFLSIWRGAIFPLAIIGADMIWRIVARRCDDAGADRLGRVALQLYLTPALLVALVCLSDAWGTRGLFSYSMVSWFHAVLFATAAFVLYLGAWLRQRDVAGQGSAVAALVLMVLAVAAACWLFRQQLGAGIGIVTGGNLWVDSIAQYQTMGGADLLRNFGLSILVMPCALFLLRTEPLAPFPWRRFLLIWTLTIAVAALARVRYAEYLPLNAAIMAGVAVFFLQVKYVRKTAFPAGLLAPVTLLAVLLLQSTTWPYFATLKGSGGNLTVRGDLEQTMLWLRDNTPAPGDPYRPARKPAYGVLARWDYGGWIESVALRPSVATNYGTETYGMEVAAHFFLSADEGEVSALLRKNGVRYLVVDKVLGDLPMYAKLIGSTQSFFAERSVPGSNTTMYVPTPEAMGLVVSRLFFADGSQAQAVGLDFAPVEGVRLVYESSSPAEVSGFPWEVKKLKVFEVADGGAVVVRGAPGSAVTLEVPVVTNQGRRFVYRNQKRCGSDGAARFRLLYPPRKDATSTGAVGPAQFTSGGRSVALSYSEADLRAGKEFSPAF